MFWQRFFALFYLTEWARIFEYLSHLLNKGYSAPQALDLTLARPARPFITTQLQGVKRRLLCGDSILQSFSPILSRVMAYHFPEGQHIPDLSRFFGDLAEALRRRNTTFKFLIKELSYPTFLIVSFFGFFIFFYLFILPLFSSFFSNFNLSVPQAIIFIQHLAHLSPSKIILGPLFVIAILAFYLRLIYRKLVFPYQLSEHFRGWALLLKSGVSLKKSLIIYPPSFQSPTDYDTFKSRLNSSGDIITELSISIPFSTASLSILSDGLRSGRFSEALLQVSDDFHELAFTRINRIIRLIKPILLLLFGALILIMVHLLFLPMIEGISLLQ